MCCAGADFRILKSENQVGQNRLGFETPKMLPQTLFGILQSKRDCAHMIFGLPNPKCCFSDGLGFLGSHFPFAEAAERFIPLTQWKTTTASFGPDKASQIGCKIRLAWTWWGLWGASRETKTCFEIMSSDWKVNRIPHKQQYIECAKAIGPTISGSKKGSSTTLEVFS
jgi:hypothetical protein